ncbi:MAG: alpha/beta hydrolase [Acidimicrobiia bacterium]
MRSRCRSVVVVVVALNTTTVAVGCSSDNDADTAEPTSAPKEQAVGSVTEAFVNATEPASTNASAGSTDRSLVTTVFYPATGTAGAEPVADAPADRRDGPYPLIVFSHGLGATPAAYQELLMRWAAAGYVVAAPAFPKTNAQAAGGIDPGDFANQPTDVSAVITGMLDATDGAGPLAGLVEPDNVGVAGHSLGGITTLGVAANSCCLDDRVQAAVVMSGDPLMFPNGDFDYGDAPPILLVHGTADDLVTYEASVDVFNEAKAPKGVLTIEKGDHGAPMNPSGPAFGSIVRTTTDFFDAYLRDDPNALDRLEAHGNSSRTRVVFVAEPGTDATLPTQPSQPARELEASVTPDTGLTNGQTVTVSWSGFTPGKTINIVQCSNRTAGDASACDLKTGKILQPNPIGNGSLPMQVVTGPVGTGVCDATTPDCQIVFNDGGSLDPKASVRISISFAPPETREPYSSAA